MKCIKCNLDKGIEEFYKTPYDYTCKVCRKEYQQERTKNMSVEQKRKRNDKKNAKKRGISLEEYYKEVAIINESKKNGKKYCYTCCEVKELSDFGKHKLTQDNLTTICKKCNLHRNKKYYVKNLDVERERAINKYRNLDKQAKNKIRKRITEYINRKIKENPVEGIKVKYRSLLLQAINTYFKTNRRYKITKKNPLYEVLGCDIEFLIKHLESQFYGGMTWENKGSKGWHVDHIIELKTASTIDEVKKLNHYTNLQPLWYKDNLAKNRKYK
jgi:hypothetical protein